MQTIAQQKVVVSARPVAVRARSARAAAAPKASLRQAQTLGFFAAQPLAANVAARTASGKGFRQARFARRKRARSET